MTTSQYLPYWLVANHIPNVGIRTIKKWLAYFTNMEMLFRASAADLSAAGVAEELHSYLLRPNWQVIEQDLKWQEQAPHHHLLCLEDEAYPLLLKEIYDPPLVLYIDGNRDVLNTKQIAIVGARHASTGGMTNAEQFAYTLASAGFTITSGLALGIDGSSHRGALRAKGKTIGVAGTGVNYIYPKVHKKLAEEIIREQGAIVSELPLSTPPQATNFPKRNRIIAGLAAGVLVVEAAVKSGSLITARLAADQGREVFALPGSIHQPLSRGCHYLIKQGAKLIETSQEIIEELGTLCAIYQDKKDPLVQSAGKSMTKHQATSPLSAQYQAALSWIDYAITPMDMILCRSGLGAGDLSTMLITLELEGYIQSVSGGYIRLQ